MHAFNIGKMNDYSGRQIDSIAELEQLCKQADRSCLRVGIESLKQTDGDEAFLCHDGDRLIGFLSWYTSDGAEGNLNAMVHPEYRRRGICRSLLRQALSEMKAEGIQSCRIKVPEDSAAGNACVQHAGARYDTSEFFMIMEKPESSRPTSQGHITFRTAEEQDWPFLIRCSSQAFGDPESWTEAYFNRTSGPSSVTYTATDGSTPVGMLRVNYVREDIAFIYNFCVLPDYQGKGYGREILASAVGQLQRQALSEIRISVVTGNKRALHLYRSAGFAVSAESRYYVISMQDLSRTD